MKASGFSQILPELVSGRGTIRHRRMVEGQARACGSHDGFGYAVRVAQHLSGSDTKCLNSRRPELIIADYVSPRPIFSVVCDAIYLDSETRIATIKVQNERPARMLASKFEAQRISPQCAPQQNFGKAHFFTKAPRIANDFWRRFWRNVFEHLHHPSTILRMVPLPESSSGRILRNTA